MNLPANIETIIISSNEIADLTSLAIHLGCIAEEDQIGGESP